MIKLLVKNIFKQNKKSYIAIIGVCISVALIFTSISVLYSFNNMRYENAYETYGRYNLLLHNVTNDKKEEIINELKKCDVEIGLEGICGSNGVLEMIVPDEEAIDMNNYELQNGTMPVAENEIAISPSYLYEEEFVFSNKNIGDEIVLNEKKYIITGFLDDYNFETSDYYKVGIVASHKCNKYNIYVHFNNRNEYKEKLNKIKNVVGGSSQITSKEYGIAQDIKCIQNEVVNWIEIDQQGTLEDKNTNTLINRIITIFVVMSLIMIIHIFVSYFSERPRQATVLNNIGYSRCNIIFNYISESLFLIIIGTALGLIMGTQISGFISEYVQNKRMTRLHNFSPCYDKIIYINSVKISIIAFVVGAIPAVIGCVSNKNKGIRYKSKTPKNSSNKLLLIKMNDNDEKYHKFEKISTYALLIISAVMILMLLYITKYIDKTIDDKKKEDSSDAEFFVALNDVSLMDKVKPGIKGITYYVEMYNTSGSLDLPEQYVTEAWKNQDYRNEDGTVSCQFNSITEEEYYKQFTLSDDMEYDEFVESGKLLLIDGDGLVIPENDSFVYSDWESGEWSYRGGIIDAIRTEYRDDRKTDGLEFFAPIELFKNKFQYSFVLIKINVETGMEIENAKYLAECKNHIQGFNFQDNVTNYIYMKDDRTTFVYYTRLAVAFVLLTTLFSLYLSNKHKYERQKKYCYTASILGCSNWQINISRLIVALMKVMPSAIIANFLVNVYCKSELDEEISNVVCNGFIKDLIICIISIVIIQILSQINVINRKTVIRYKE